jgi:uncharacterized protein (TIGR04255 family)
MTTVFRNPPLIEMIAELRWSGQGQSTIPVIMPGANGPVEAMFVQWTARMGALGYEHVERLVPVGFPLPLDAPTLRVKQKTGMPQNTLFQLGPQLFTANATPPYLSWQDFAPTAREGVTALLAVRPEPEATAPFQVALRYIDAFREPLLRGQTPMQFLSETLGIAVEAPPAITRQAESGAELGALIQLIVPVAGGVMRVQFAEGIVSNDPALIMDMTVSRTESVDPRVDAIMHALGQARAITHDVFMELTTRIADLMQPEVRQQEEA